MLRLEPDTKEQINNMVLSLFKILIFFVLYIFCINFFSNIVLKCYFGKKLRIL